MSNEDGASMLSEEILLKSFSYMDPTEIILTAGTCRSWRSIIRGPKCSMLLKKFAEKHTYLPYLDVTPATLNDIEWYDFFVRFQRLYSLANETLERYINTSVASIRESEDLEGQCSHCGRKPYEGPTSGTTATAIPDSTGRFTEPVYYDWGSNWGLVSELVETQEVQQILMKCVNEVTDGYYFTKWNENTIWPFLFNSHRRYGNGEQEALIAKHLSATQVRELNEISADRLLANWETYFSLDTGCLATQMAIQELESGMQVDEDAMYDEVDEMLDWWDEYYNSQLYQSVSNQITEAAEAILYSKSGVGSVHEVLLCTIGASYAFMPLNYILAKLVSPDDANLKVCFGREYSVVFDEERNIVFDNNWYFLGVPASEALDKSRQEPDGSVCPSRIDYTLGGLVN